MPPPQGLSPGSCSLTSERGRPPEPGGPARQVPVEGRAGGSFSGATRPQPGPEVLTGRLLRGPLNLVDLILDCEDRLEAVVTFVALLELLRQGRVTVRQKEAFGDIVVGWIQR